MERFTDAAQGYCEMYCKKYGHCFGDPGECVFKDEVKMYEALKGYEFTGMSPADIRIMEISALREQEQRRWIPVAERLPQNYISVLVYTPKAGLFPLVHEAYIGDDGEWHSSVFYGIENEDVTHWMPMPEPPKEV